MFRKADRELLQRVRDSQVSGSVSVGNRVVLNDGRWQKVFNLLDALVKHQGDLERAIRDQSATDYTDRTQDLDNRFKELSEKITLELGLTLNGIVNGLKKSSSLRRKR